MELDTAAVRWTVACRSMVRRSGIAIAMAVLPASGCFPDPPECSEVSACPPTGDPCVENICIDRRCEERPIDGLDCGADAEVAETASADAVDVADGSATDVAETRDVFMPDVEGDSSEADTRAETRDAADDDAIEAPADAEVDVDVTEHCPGEGEPCISPGECGPGVMECGQAGATRCSSSPGGSDSVASEEACDGLDNDCDGDTDEDYAPGGRVVLDVALSQGDVGKALGEACGAGLCAGGEVVCAADMTSLSCASEANAARVELCNDVDDDCDGVVDQGFDYRGAPLATACDGEGACGAGTVVCAVGSTAVATCSTNADGPDSQASAERCDGVDNDCDGLTDEGMTYGGAPVGSSCDGIGACGAGTVACAASGGATCSTNPDGASSQATPEVCDGADNDCDGVVDDNCASSCDPPCEHQGTCVALDTCDCAGTGYTGSRCDVPVCVLSCLNGGACTAPDTCSCGGTGYSGARCETPVCTQSCLNGGTCTAPHTCTCTGTGYTGARCETPVCTQSCLNGGVCSAPNTCDCVGTGYGGARCETPVCSLSCLNGGACSAPDTCDCTGTGYVGSRCETPSCSPACANGGACIALNSCDCTGTGYSGAYCQSPVCVPTCQHGGTCVGPNSCDCEGTGYTGAFCETPVCSPTCANGGTCVEPGRCECPPAVTGATCQTLPGFSKILPGVFLMGSPSTEVGRGGDEAQHQVQLTRALWMKNTEVTQLEWQNSMGNNPSYPKECGITCPVQNLTWFDAIAYANKLSRSQGLSECYSLQGCSGTPGADEPPYVCSGVTFVGPSCNGYRLPTEAEWEYAARAGTTTSTYNGNLSVPDGADATLDPIAWYNANSEDGASGYEPHPGGQKQPNAWGLYDMLGNVFEWTHDRYRIFGTGSEVDPVDTFAPPLGYTFVARGGAFQSPAFASRAAYRLYSSDDIIRGVALGFRVVRTIP